MTMTPRNPKNISPSRWPADWFARIFSAVDSVGSSWKFQFSDKKDGPTIDQRLWWRACILALRDIKLCLTVITTIKRESIAPDGTLVISQGGLPIIVKLSRDTIEAIEALHTVGPKILPMPTHQNTGPRAKWVGFRMKRDWQPIAEAAGFDADDDSDFPVPFETRRVEEFDEATGMGPDGKPLTILAFLEKIYKPLRLGFRSERTLKLYEISIRNFGRYLGRQPLLTDLNDETLSGFLSDLGNRTTVSQHTILKEYSQITAIWRFACVRRLIQFYPTIKKPHVPRTDPKSWSPDDLVKLFKAIDETEGAIAGVPASRWWRALLYVIWNSGERIGAVLGLQRSDVDLSSGWVTFRAEIRKGRGEDKTHRLADYTIAALRDVLRSQGNDVFRWPGDQKTIYGCFGELLKRAGLPADRKSKFHRLRRTVATQFELLGGDATKLLGHFDRKVTENHYLDPRVIKRQQAIDLLPQPGLIEVGNPNAAVLVLEVSPKEAQRLPRAKLLTK